ncbi:MAG: transposase [Gammaproteobacteria bacterium]|nr:transposase [Gammaproteobacteria bacterium]
MPRQLRYPLCGVPQHVVQRGHNRQATFFTDFDYHYYLDCLLDAAVRHECAVHAYVLMGNHVHLLLTPSTPFGIAKVMQSVGRCYVRYLNDSQRRSGTLWEGRYKACPVDSENYLLACYRYIELNPLRATAIQCLSDYRWSSYPAHALGKRDLLITDHAQYLALGRTACERQAVYAKLFCKPLEEATLAQVRAAIHQCLVLGNERFKDQIELALARKVRPGKAGRPKKEIIEPLLNSVPGV